MTARQNKFKLNYYPTMEGYVCDRLRYDDKFLCLIRADYRIRSSDYLDNRIDWIILLFVLQEVIK